MVRKPIAVLIADVHYNTSTLALADFSVCTSLAKADELGVPLVIAGDLHDTKANMRGECVNAILKTLKRANSDLYCVRVLVGNHDLLNVKGKAHALEFLRSDTKIVDTAFYDGTIDAWLLPYYDDLRELKQVLDVIPTGSKIIMHQGVKEAWKGHYIHDETAAPAEWFANFRVISGHYHRAQTINCRNGRRLGKNEAGSFSYIGNPYTLTFAEANDGPKGYQILYEDGTLEQKILDLRKHKVFRLQAKDVHLMEKIAEKEDICEVHLLGQQTQVDSIDKTDLGMRLFGHDNYRLMREADKDDRAPFKVDVITPRQNLINLIDSLIDSDDNKKYLKSLLEDLEK